ncbi:MAG: STAS domain-containing protein [bacterium]|nr:anti-sigma factor antagonist [Planctomycetota bacterium]HIL52153.1 anti-sigma factor antagonist [Planctomycetota bacterium]
MHITVEPRETYAVLHLRGEFDTYYVPVLQEEINGLLKVGMPFVILNMRLVRFLNSTALGAIIKASKQLAAEGGKLVISRPSKFSRDILEKVGLDRVVAIYDSDEEAASHLDSEVQPTDENVLFEEDRSSVIFSPLDSERVAHFVAGDGKQTNPVHGHSFGEHWSGIGRMAGLDEKHLRFTWNGGNTDLEPFAMAQFTALGTEWKIKFRLPLLQKGYCEAVACISEVEERPDGIKVQASFKEIDAETQAAVKQYAADMAYLKDELRKATDS